MKAAVKLGVRADTVRHHIDAVKVKQGLSSSRDLLACDPSEEFAMNEAGLLELLESQEFRCALTGEPLTPDDATLDHRIPVSAGGQHDLSNVWWVHKDVNTAKGTMGCDEFVAMCKRVASHVK
jgi:5-methylcytosine-specific restriction endonuclease McrA